MTEDPRQTDPAAGEDDAALRMLLGDMPAPPSLPAIPVVDAVPEPPPAPGPRFCTRCGAPWQPHWTTCEVCRQAAQRFVAAQSLREAAAGSIGSALWLYFVFLGCTIIGMIAVYSGARILAVEFVTVAMSSILVLIWCAASSRDVLPPLVRLPAPGWWAAAVGGSLVTFAFAAAIIGVLTKFAGVPELRLTDEFINAGYGRSMIFLIIAVQPAIIEELAFRGVIMKGLQSFLSPTESILVSALMFMILHLSVPSFPHLLALGLALGYLRQRTGSLYPCMLLHFCHNSICIIQEFAKAGQP